jgi:hypothetical protein
MAKISLRVFKKGKPIFWIIGAVFVFVIFYMLFNKSAKAGASDGGGVSYVSSGPSEALQAQAMQVGAAIQGAQIAAGVETAKVQEQANEATLGAQVALAQLAAGQTVQLRSIDADLDVAHTNAAANVAINDANLNYGLETASIAATRDITLKQIDANTLAHQMDTNALLVVHQLDTQADMFAEQSKTLTQQSLIAQVGNVKKKQRGAALLDLAQGFATNDFARIELPKGGGGFGFGDIVGVVSPLTNLMH